MIKQLQLCLLVSFSTVCGINGTLNIKFEHNLCIIKINKCLVAKNLLMNVTKNVGLQRIPIFSIRIFGCLNE